MDRTNMILLGIALIAAVISPFAPDTLHASSGDVRHNSFRIDYTVTIGNILTIIAILLGGFAAWSSLSAKVAVLTAKVDAMWSRFLREMHHNPGEKEE